jgi:hypothetical protein
VIVGKDGWLYLGEDVQAACRPAFAIDDTLARLERLERVITDSGRRLVLVVAPDKSSILPEHLPDSYPGEECASRHRREFWASFTGDPPVSTYVDLRGPLLRQQADDREPIYRVLDTHWAPRGATVYVRELAAALEPAIWQGTRVERTGDVELGGGLAEMLGRPRRETVSKWEVIRPGVRGNFASVGLSGSPVTISNASTGVALFTPRSALLVDSFSLPQISGAALYSLFADARAVFSEGATPLTIAGMVAEAETVVVEAVERYVVSGASSLLRDDTLAAITAAVGG